MPKPERQPKGIIHASCRPDAIGAYAGLITMSAGVAALLFLDESTGRNVSSAAAISTGALLTWRFRRSLRAIFRSETGDDLHKL